MNRSAVGAWLLRPCLPAIAAACISSFAYGSDGTHWLRQQMNPGVRVVLSADGVPLMRVAMPDEFQIMWATKQQVWGVLPDADDVPVILRYRVVAQ